jgi:hypothetical protein
MQVLKAVVAEFDAGELITQRELVSHRVHQVISLLQRLYSLYRNVLLIRIRLDLRQFGIGS